MITNPDIIEKKYKCNKWVKNYLIRCQIPLLSFDKRGNYYFADTEKLRECLKKMPLDVKFFSIFK